MSMHMTVMMGNWGFNFSRLVSVYVSVLGVSSWASHYILVYVNQRAPYLSSCIYVFGYVFSKIKI